MEMMGIQNILDLEIGMLDGLAASGVITADQAAALVEHYTEIQEFTT